MALRQPALFHCGGQGTTFGRAAEPLGFSQPAMSRQIRDLETEIGVTLFDPKSRGCSFRLRDRHFSNMRFRSRSRTNERASTPSEQIAVKTDAFGSVSTTSRSLMEHVPRFFKQFRSAYPGIRLDLIAMSSIKQLEALSGGGLDLGFVYFYEVREQFNHLVLGREDLLLAVHTTHPLARKQAIQIRDLVDEFFIGIRRDVMPDYHDRVIAACRRKGPRRASCKET